jgi:hypothetical protein
MPYGVPQHTSDYLRNSSGSLAMFAAMRRASSLLSSLTVSVMHDEAVGRYFGILFAGGPCLVIH